MRWQTANGVDFSLSEMNWKKKVEDEIKKVEEEKTPEDRCDKCGKEDVLIDYDKQDAFLVLKVFDDKSMCDECI